MATPGGPYNPMMQPQMGQTPQSMQSQQPPPVAAVPPPKPARPGTSKAVPVVVSAGLAVGVFCGLLFGLGTGDTASASSDPVATSDKKAEPAVNKADDKKAGDKKAGDNKAGDNKADDKKVEVKAEDDKADEAK